MISVRSSSDDMPSESCLKRSSNHAALLRCEVSARVSRAFRTSVQVNISNVLAMRTPVFTAPDLPGRRRGGHGGAFPMGIAPTGGRDVGKGDGLIPSGAPPHLHRPVEEKADGAGAVASIQLADGLLDVAVHRLGRDAELPADGLGCPVLRREVQALALAGGEPVNGGLGSG